MRRSENGLARIFSSRRLLFLIRRDVFLSGRSIVIISITLFLVIVVISIINNFSRHSGFSHFLNFSVTLFIAGYIMAARAFIDIHDKSRAYEWFMLPASILEKFLTRLIITSLGWAVLFTIIYSVASLFGETMNLIIFGYRHVLFNPFSERVLLAVLQYLITQSVFLFGAVYFRKNHFIKTLLAILIVGIGFLLVCLLVWRIFFSSYFPWLFNGNGYEGLTMSLDWESFVYEGEKILNAFGRVIRVVYYLLFAPFFWLLSYLRITETEVKNGV